MKEKRKFPEYESMYKVVCALAKNPNNKFYATSFNVSMGGIWLNLKNFIKRNKYLNLAVCNPKRDLTSKPNQTR